jgi:hypothetical protein
MVVLNQHNPPSHLPSETSIMRFFWCSLILLSLVCGCSKKPAVNTANDTDKKKPKTSGNYPTSSRATKNRSEMNANNDNFSNKSGLDEILMKDLDSSNIADVKLAIEHFQGNKFKGALPKLEAMAKNHKDADIKRRAQAAVDFIKK